MLSSDKIAPCHALNENQDGNALIHLMKSVINTLIKRVRYIKCSIWRKSMVNSQELMLFLPI